MDVMEEIKNTVESNPIVLFMKGSPNFPQCGFSAVVVQILNDLKVEYKDINILLDQDLRQGIKDFSDWPTIPQLYVKGEFIGGCDIIKEMVQEGELQELFSQNGIITAA